MRTAETSSHPPVVADAHERGVAEAHGHATRSPASVPAPPAAAHRVLVVDPCEDTVLTTSWLLRLWGYDVRSAATGPLALEAAREYRPDAILMEVRLPGLDGWAVARQLVDSDDRPARCLIAVTGHGGERDRARSRAAGFDCHLLKPVCPDVLRERLASVTGITEVRQRSSEAVRVPQSESERMPST